LLTLTAVAIEQFEIKYCKHMYHCNYPTITISPNVVPFSLSGVSHYTKIADSEDENVFFNETFQWPVARPIEKDEFIDIQLYSYNKYLSNR